MGSTGAERAGIRSAPSAVAAAGHAAAMAAKLAWL